MSWSRRSRSSSAASRQPETSEKAIAARAALRRADRVPAGQAALRVDVQHGDAAAAGEAGGQVGGEHGLARAAFLLRNRDHHRHPATPLEPHHGGSGDAMRAGGDGVWRQRRNGQPEIPTTAQLFVVFARIGLTSFGGGLSGWLLREFVQRRGWLGEEEFLSGLALAQAFPGVNVVNLAIWIGYRLRGTPGALAGAAASSCRPRSWWS